MSDAPEDNTEPVLHVQTACQPAICQTGGSWEQLTAALSTTGLTAQPATYHLDDDCTRSAFIFFTLEVVIIITS